MKELLFILGIVVFVAVIFVFFDNGPAVVPSSLDDATKADRCAKFRTVDSEDSQIYSLGYKGRIEQLLHGCF